MDQGHHHTLLIDADNGTNGGLEDSPFSISLSRMASSSSDYHQIFMNRVDGDESGIYDDDDDDLALGDCGYSRPFVVLDVIWNLAFVVVSVFMLLTTIGERPSAPLRLWIGGYALQCLLHVGFVWVEYQRRNFDDLVGLQFHGLSLFALGHSSVMKRLESINTVISSIWWIFGFYWIFMGGQALLQDSPHLYWLSVVFLAFDVFFVIFCIAMAFMVFVAVFCCLPILASVAYAMKLGEGASDNDIRTLPKYRYCQSNTMSNFPYDYKALEEGESMPKLSLSPEDSECCICLNSYSDGAELCTLPCNHHFHHRCICKWLRINATCPLCKFNILSSETLV
nr:E3 ubiquitin-protein ligase At4g11680-like isoform X1 [Ipomoea batatas]